ncbi:unnamed protein product [Periconia digitata]|uniref:N-terminal nucleophile aminohydrolase n=1 Tax=Periconia digitata TaxID=1303443 RepID=A0A9W4U9X6_9PLEO|nr:unnamed protein product [Periconia digitata]
MTSQRTHVTPRIIIHGGAGNITRNTISKERYDAYQASLRRILAESATLLNQKGATALDVATYAVSLLEDDELYNSGKGAVFTRKGKNELECSIMVSNGYRKRGVGCMMLQRARNPIKLARELLIRGEMEGGDGSGDHCQYSGAFAERLAEQWGLELVDPSYFFTQQRWDEHRRGLKEKEGISGEMSDWEKSNYIPLGTCGAVVLDSFGTVCAATSTGGLTNKIPGRIGDTPTLGTGFWAGEWHEEIKRPSFPRVQMRYQPNVSPLDKLSRGYIGSLMGDCFSTVEAPGIEQEAPHREKHEVVCGRRAIGVSGTGNGDSFLRLSASNTTANKSRFSQMCLAKAISWMAGPDGELQKSAGDRWGRTHEGTGGMIGIELVGEGKGEVVFDFNCDGMFRAWIDEGGEQKCMIFREEEY